MWLIALMLLLMLPITAAALVYLLNAAWRLLDALLQGTIGALRLTWRATVWAARASGQVVRMLHLAAVRLRDGHYAGSTWAGQYLQSCWLAWSNMVRRRYIAGQLRRRRRERHTE